jgi:hypothetical protein
MGSGVNRFRAAGGANPNIETRNPKQIPITESQMTKTGISHPGLNIRTFDII